MQIHVHLRPSFMEGEIRMCQLGLSFLLDSKFFLSQGRLCMWTRVENGGRSLLAWITIIQCSYVRDLASSLRFPTKKKKRSHFPLVCMKFVARIGSHPQHLISDKACEINTKVRFIAAGKRLSTHLSSKKQASQFRCTWKGYRRPGKED